MVPPLRSHRPGPGRLDGGCRCPRRQPAGEPRAAGTSRAPQIVLPSL